MTNRITIKDIAKALNIHHSTVSRALRNDQRVNEKTRKKIITYAEDKGYQVNMNALQLRGESRNVIAIIVPNINHNFFSNIISSIANLAEQKGYIVSIFQTNESLVQEKTIIDTIIKHNVAGVVASVSMETTTSEHFKKLKKYNIPLVMFDRVLNDFTGSKVTINNSKIVEQAINLLTQRECKHIAHIGGPQQVNVFYDRHRGYLNAIANKQLAYSNSVLINKGFSFTDGQNAIQELFNKETVPDGLICDSSILLVGALIELKKLNMQPSKKIQIVGFIDNPYIKAFSSGIISIHQPEDQVAQKSFDLLMKNIENKHNQSTENISIEAIISESN